MTTRLIRWLLVLLSVVAYQGLLAEYLCPGGIGLRYDLLVVFLAGLIGGAARGAIAGGLVGFITDCLTPNYLGWGMMVNATVGLAAGMSRDRLFLERAAARWLVFAVGIAIHEIIYLLPVSGFDPSLYGKTLLFDSSISMAITSVVGTAVLVTRQAWRRPVTGGTSVNSPT
jgi:uncharacterized membrane protein